MKPIDWLVVGWLAIKVIMEVGVYLVLRFYFTR